MGADSHPDEARVQLDLFLDGEDARLVGEIATALSAVRTTNAAAALDRLRLRNPRHPDLVGFGLLCRAQRAEAPPRADPAAVVALVEEIESVLVSAADRLLGMQAGRALHPVWQRLVAAASALPIEAGRATAPVFHWLGVAHHHLGELRPALRRWLSLCWLDPEGFARYAPRVPNSMIRDAWAAFQRPPPDLASTPDGEHESVRWFPAWLLLRQRGLVHLFQPAEIPDTDPATQAFRLLLRLLLLERDGHSAELIRQRSALQRLAPGFFRHYLRVVAGPPDSSSRPHPRD